MRFELRWEDYLEAQLLHMQRTTWLRWLWWLLLGGQLLVLFAPFYIWIQKGIPFWTYPTYFLPPVFILGFAALYRFVLLPAQTRRIFSQQKNLNVPFTLETTDETLNISNVFGSEKAPWGHIIKFIENDKVMLLYRSEVIFTLLPKRFFTDPTQIELLRANLLKAGVKIPAKTKARPKGCTILIVILFVIACLGFILATKIE